MKNRKYNLLCSRSLHAIWQLVLLLLFVLMVPQLVLADTGGEAKTEIGIDEYSKIGKDLSHDKELEARLDPHKTSTSMTDHSKFKQLQGPFENGSQVTTACLECHNEAGHAFMENKHWTWKYTDPDTGQKLGKSVLINNFCTNARGNEGMCAQCHAGYNMTDSNFDFSNQNNIDCLVCHESTGKYYKTPPTTGSKACSVMFEGKKPIDWAASAKSVVNPTRANCGACHFYGGGGDNVKHGDLSSALFNPDEEVDVHMATMGNNFSCTSCHVGEKHQWSGSRYQMVPNDEKHQGKPGMGNETASCASCHGKRPHPTSIEGVKLNDHTDRVACETCHIPTFAKGGVATKVDWDWEPAGKTKNGEGYKESTYTQGNGEHRYTYKSIKGAFKYAENVVPEYLWSNGKSKFTTIETQFDPSKPVYINAYMGAADDPESLITPFKVMHTRQPYDKKNNTLVYMHLWGDDEDAFWGNYDFQKAITRGMGDYDVPYSGEYGFIDSYSLWPINHMVTTKENALACNECHSRNGRLENVEGVYMPGTAKQKWLDILGVLAVLATLAGVLGHGLLRFVLSPKEKH